MEKCHFLVTLNSEYGKQLESLHQAYIDGDEYALSDAIALLRKKIEKVSRVYGKQTGIPAEEFDSAITRAIWKAFDGFDADCGASFTSFLSWTATRAMIDIMKRAEGTYAKHVVLSALDTLYGDEDYAVPEVIEYRDGIATAPSSISYVTDDHFESIADASRDVEAEVIDRMMVEEQRELIDYLYDQAPEHVRAYVSEMYDRNGVRFNQKTKKGHDRACKYDLSEEQLNKSLQEEIDEITMTQIAKKLGVHHSKVIRGIRSLRGFYDVKKFGDLNDYVLRTREIFPRY